jgi:hypothetical protein
MSSEQSATVSTPTNHHRTLEHPLVTAGALEAMDDLQWASTAPEVQQHAGKFVVIHKKRIVAVGTDYHSVLEEASTAEGCPWWELAVDVVPPAEPDEIPD